MKLCKCCHERMGARAKLGWLCPNCLAQKIQRLGPLVNGRGDVILPKEERVIDGRTVLVSVCPSLAAVGATSAHPHIKSGSPRQTKGKYRRV